MDLDDQDSPTLRISYARALNNPKVREGRAAAEEPRSSTPLEVRVDRPQPYRDPRSPLDPRGSRDMLRGPAEPYGQVGRLAVSNTKDGGVLSQKNAKYARQCQAGRGDCLTIFSCLHCKGSSAQRLYILMSASACKHSVLRKGKRSLYA